MTKLWLDDVRYPPPLWEDVVWVKTAPDAIQALQKREFDEISLDHDLGDPKAGEGYDVLTWIEFQVRLNGFKCPKRLRCHSANPPASDRMERAIAAILTAMRERDTV